MEDMHTGETRQEVRSVVTRVFSGLDRRRTDDQSERGAGERRGGGAWEDICNDAVELRRGGVFVRTALLGGE
jgi:hypothetical protein